eukprot:SAG31_NODE_10912_length_1085_cov_0.921907_1_plen_190_part_10
MREGTEKVWAQRSPKPVADAEADDAASLEAAERSALRHQYHNRIHSSWRVTRVDPPQAAAEPEPQEVEALGWRAVEARKTARARAEMTPISDLTESLAATLADREKHVAAMDRARDKNCGGLEQLHLLLTDKLWDPWVQHAAKLLAMENKAAASAASTASATSCSERGSGCLESHHEAEVERFLPQLNDE